jgi:cell division transport system permease protein
MRFRILAAEAWRSLAANASTTIAATMTVLIGMFILGLSISLGSYMWSWSKNVKHELVVNVYFCTTASDRENFPWCGKDATTGEINRVGNLLSTMPEVRRVQFISRAEALRIMKRKSPELTENLPGNPLPASFKVIPRRGEDVFRIAQRVNTARPPGVEHAQTGEETARRILRVATVIEIIFGIAIVILATASALLIANTIRLSIFSRRREIEVMKLVGATNWFVRGPFMLEGLICGIAGAVLAVVLLFAAKEIALPALLRFDEGSSGEAHAIGFAWNAMILLGFGLLLGAAGSGLTIRRFLKV